MSSSMRIVSVSMRRYRVPQAVYHVENRYRCANAGSVCVFRKGGEREGGLMLALHVKPNQVNNFIAQGQEGSVGEGVSGTAFDLDRGCPVDD